MARLAEKYDVICTGGSFASYLCAALLSNAGKKVLVIDDEDHVFAHEYGEQYQFEPDYSLFAGLSENAVLGQSLRELGLEPHMMGFRSIESVNQVLSPNYRIVFDNDENKTKTEVEREFDQEASEVWALFSKMYRAGKDISSFVDYALTPAQGSRVDNNKWKRFWGQLYGVFQSPRPLGFSQAVSLTDNESERLSTAILGGLTYAAPMNLGVEQATRGISVLLQGMHYVQGGPRALKAEFSKIIRSAGGSIKENAKVDALITEDNKIIGVLLSSHEGIIRGDLIAMSNKINRIYKTLPVEMQDPSVIRSLNRVRPSHWRYTLSVTVKKTVIPIGMTPHMTQISSYHFPLEEENFLKIQILPEDKESDQVTLLVTALVPYRASTMDYRYLQTLSGRVLHALSEVIPFLKENILRIYPDFQASVDNIAAVYPFRGPDWLPENLLQYYVQGSKSVQDFQGPSWTTPHPNLYFLGRIIWPSLGTYGEALSARKVFQDILYSTLQRDGADRDQSIYTPANAGLME